MVGERLTANNTYLYGLRLGYYRGIGSQQSIGPFRQFNFFAGPNNAGKSTLLRFLHDYGPILDPKTPRHELDKLKPGLSVSERYQGKNPEECYVARGFSPRGLLTDLRSSARSPDAYASELETLAELVKRFSPDVIWQKDRLSNVQAESIRTVEPKEDLALRRLYDIFGVTHQTDNAIALDVVRDRVVQQRISASEMPEVLTIPAFRSVKPGNGQLNLRTMDGTELIKVLFSFMNHDIGEDGNREKFEKINHFLKSVLRKKDAEIQIPADANKIIVKMDDKRLELKDLGTGIEEVIMIGAYCTINQGSIICMEEPEIHLHPVLQKRLMQYLKHETTNQYFIATHSAALIDMEGASVFHVSNDGNSTKVVNLETRSSRRLLIDDLGYLPSDVVQSNSVIWVEGPSDRLYLLNWIEQVAPEISEGIHFSIMSYGGSLLSNLTGDPERLEKFINLKSLNQCSAIVMDSDHSSVNENPKGAKRRLKTEFSAANGFSWITKGREIENYLDPDKLLDAMKIVHPKVFGKPYGLGDYDNRLKFKHSETGKPSTANKVSVAKKLCEEPLDLEILDLKKQIKGLVAFIRKSNGI